MRVERTNEYVEALFRAWAAEKGDGSLEKSEFPCVFVLLVLPDRALFDSSSLYHSLLYTLDLNGGLDGSSRCPDQYVAFGREPPLSMSPLSRKTVCSMGRAVKWVSYNCL